MPFGEAVGLIRGTGTDSTSVSSIGAQFPYLSANLDFSGEPSLAERATGELRDAAGYATTAATLADPAALAATASGADKAFAPWTIVTENGGCIGVIGATTQQQARLTSLGGVRVLDPAGDGGVDNTAELAAILQPYVDQLAAQGVDKVVLVSHMQQYQLELDLATRLSGVDVIVAGGSHEVFANPGNPLRPNQTAAQPHPVLRTGADGDPVAVVNAGAEYGHIGRLGVRFDANGVIDPASIDPAVSGNHATTDARVQALWAGADPFAPGTRGGIVAGLTDAVGAVIAAKDGTVFGRTRVFLEGRRTAVRTQKTNLGDLSADAALLGRDVDAAGFAFWRRRPDAGASGAELARGVAASAEFARRHGGLSDADFVSGFSAAALGQTADADDLARWTASLGGGAPRAAVAAAIAASPEALQASAGLFDTGVRLV